MIKVPLNKDVIISRLTDIENGLSKLKKFQPLTLDEFKQGENFAIAEHYLRRTLEAILDIGAHILARIPGARPQSYKDIPKLLGENKIIPYEFADNALKDMAGYRNRLIHFYKQITIEEMHNIVQQDLKDIELFMHYIGLLLKNPQQFDLEVKP